MYVQRVTAFAGPLAGGAPGVQTDWEIYTVKGTAFERFILIDNTSSVGAIADAHGCRGDLPGYGLVTVVRHADAE